MTELETAIERVEAVRRLVLQHAQAAVNATEETDDETAVTVLAHAASTLTNTATELAKLVELAVIQKGGATNAPLDSLTVRTFDPADFVRNAPTREGGAR